MYFMRWRATSCLVLAVLLATSNSLSGEDQTGETIYREQCARCHGNHGEGTAQVGSPLLGDRSVKELARLIQDTMPEDQEQKCTPTDAEQVAAYIHETFYSIVAQERHRPARLELSHLTVRQYENMVADLIASFSGDWGWIDDRGLKGQYFKTRKWDKEKIAIERVDSTIDFQFGENPPNDQINREEFMIHWEGSVLPPATGYYELIVETENGARLYLNEGDQPLIDASVRSGDQREYRETVRFLAGRAIRIRLEFFKAKEKTASIKLRWKPPHGPDEVIPQRCLIPQWSPRTYIVTTPFPPDDRSRGYERGSAVSQEWIEATSLAAIEVAHFVVSDLDRLSHSKPDSEDRIEKVREFCRLFADRAFRRPLSDEERSQIIDQSLTDKANIEQQTLHAITRIMLSPRTLYREVNVGEFDDFDVASWLSMTLWDSIPHAPLREAAAAGQLTSRDQIRGWADSMLNSHRTRAKVRDFVHHWLRLDHYPELTKDKESFPQFTPEVVSDLHASLDLFVDDVIWNGAGDYRELLSSDHLYVNGRLAAVYGIDLPADAVFQSVSIPQQARAGLLSHPLVLASLAYEKNSSPIHRGVFVSRSLLGRQLKAPPVAVAPLAPDLHKELTTRERIALQTSPQACQSCHLMINPLGFPLEQFDAIGRFRQEDNGRPVDSSGGYVTREGEEFTFQGGGDLSRFLVNSPECRNAVVERVFHHFAKQPIRAFGNDFLSARSADLIEHNGSLPHLLVEIATESAVYQREHPTVVE